MDCCAPVKRADNLAQMELTDQRVGQVLKDVTSLKDVPLDLRRKEAGKPLYLTRYE